MSGRTLSIPLGVALVAVLVAAAAQAEARAIAFEPPPPPRFDPRVLGEVVSRPEGPPPISGGTLLVLSDGHHVVVADSDRDRVLVVDLAAPTEAPRALAFLEGAEPGRAVEDPSGRVHVVLRGRGAIASFDPRTSSAPMIREVCPMPRGIAYDARGEVLHVACRGGELVTLPAATGGPSRTVALDRDLRDVIVSGERLYVSRFRSAEVLVVGADGAIAERHVPPDAIHDDVTFAPAVAWRLIAMPGGAVAMLHQRASRNEVRPSMGGYGPMRSGGCEGIVRTAITIVGAGAITEGPEIADAVLAVDLAIVPGASGIDRLAVIAAANQSGDGALITAAAPALGAPGCLGQPISPQVDPLANAVAVAFTGDGRMLVQQRDPARLVILPADGATSTAIELGGATTFDTGHAIFHASTNAGIACASCHPEGGEDGHVWRFEGVGDRRTPALHAVHGTAPFHWSGDITDIRHLMNEVFVLRMRGTSLGPDHADAVESWLAHVPPPRASVGDRDAVARGRALFVGEAQCVTCHSGPLATNLGSADVGSGGTFQVPSLIGVVDRLPVMRSGCATTLAARFDPACGGDRHGPALSDAQQSDLIAYLASL